MTPAGSGASLPPMSDKSKHYADLARIKERAARDAANRKPPIKNLCHCGAPATIVVAGYSGSKFYCAAHIVEAEGEFLRVPVYRQK